MTDTTTFTDEMKRAEVDSWLYETCTHCLQHMVDVFVQFYTTVSPLLPRILDLLANFIRCSVPQHLSPALGQWLPTLHSRKHTHCLECVHDLPAA